MPGVFCDTVFAAVVRAVLGPGYFPHVDEIDPPSIYLQRVHLPKSSSTIGTALYDPEDPFNVHGRRGGNGLYVKQERNPGGFGDPEFMQEVSGGFKFSKPVKEEGDDSLLVTWRGPEDAEVCLVLSFVPHQINVFAKNPQNWSQVKKGWVLFQLCFLTFAVYFGGAVYTAAVPGVSEHFHVSHVASTLGLTLFLLGCGIGR